MVNIGKRINIYRKLNDMTLNDLSGDTISTAHLSKIENGYRHPGKTTLLRIASSLHLPSAFFENFEEEDPEVHHVLNQLEQFIITQIDKASPLVETIVDNYYTYLSNVYQEIYFLLLKCAFYCKTKDYSRAEATYQTYIYPFIDKDYITKAPLYIQNAYHYCEGIRHYQQSDFESSLSHYRSYSLENQTLGVKAALTYNIAVLSNAVKKYRDAAAFSHEALNYYEALSMHREVSMVYNLIGVIFLNQEEFGKSMNYLTQAEDIAEGLPNGRLLTQILHNKGVVMRKDGDNSEASSYLEKALQLKEAEGLKANKQISYHSLCKAYINLNRLDEARQLFEEAREEVRKETDYYYLLEAFLDYYYKNESYAEYQNSLEECIKFFEQDPDQEPLETLYLKLGDHMYETGKYKRAAECYLSHIKKNEIKT
ncbi:helix-turn-helix domain-containing protein [Halobacillus sp. A5]|uniref:helix-turn-helix domain-containing protein n=1 Tax=Halobacillus sp. A5 TaxID=2880263 RepID=UPI0020A68382|nr:helix-turn-helix transcriptional regulator [Halobacillus sp. A5]MCP3029328.1 helix-turn-helix transcriptional regulator [Halobacillus sp. A5]